MQLRCGHGSKSAPSGHVASTWYGGASADGSARGYSRVPRSYLRHAAVVARVNSTSSTSRHTVAPGGTVMNDAIISALVAPLVAALIGLGLSWVDNRDQRRRRDRETQLGYRQVEFINAWLDLRDRVMSTDFSHGFSVLGDGSTMQRINEDLQRAYQRAIGTGELSEDRALDSPWRRFTAAAFPPLVLTSWWAQFWRVMYWLVFTFGLAFLVALNPMSKEFRTVEGGTPIGLGVALGSLLVLLTVYVLLLFLARKITVYAERRSTSKVRSSTAPDHSGSLAPAATIDDGSPLRPWFRRFAEQWRGGRAGSDSSVHERRTDGPPADPASPALVAFPSAGWFPAPGESGERYWDGRRWTEHHRP
jgi:uncharacterized protein (DUF2062 family)